MNAVATVDLEMYRGDDKEFPFSLWVDENGTRRALTVGELTGAEMRFTVKRSRRDPDSSAVMSLVSPDDIAINTATSKCTVAITPAHTAGVDEMGETFEWDLQMKAGGKVRTLLSGALRVVGDVTRAT